MHQGNERPARPGVQHRHFADIRAGAERRLSGRAHHHRAQSLLVSQPLCRRDHFPQHVGVQGIPLGGAVDQKGRNPSVIDRAKHRHSGPPCSATFIVPGECSDRQPHPGINFRQLHTKIDALKDQFALRRDHQRTLWTRSSNTMWRYGVTSIASMRTVAIRNRGGHYSPHGCAAEDPGLAPFPPNQPTKPYAVRGGANRTQGAFNAGGYEPNAGQTGLRLRRRQLRLSQHCRAAASEIASSLSRIGQPNSSRIDRNQRARHREIREAGRSIPLAVAAQFHA